MDKLFSLLSKMTGTFYILQDFWSIQLMKIKIFYFLLNKWKTWPKVILNEIVWKLRTNLYWMQKHTKIKKKPVS